MIPRWILTPDHNSTSFKNWKVMFQNCKNKLEPKWTLKVTISINFNTENFDALKTLRINRSRQKNSSCPVCSSVVTLQKYIDILNVKQEKLIPQGHYIIKLKWFIKKYDLSREVRWTDDKSPYLTSRCHCSLSCLMTLLCVEHVLPMTLKYRFCAPCLPYLRLENKVCQNLIQCFPLTHKGFHIFWYIEFVERV